MTDSDLQWRVVELSEEVSRLQRINNALVEASERRLESTAEASSFNRWENTVALRRLVDDRTAEIQATAKLMMSIVNALDGRISIVSADGTILGTNAVWDEVFDPEPGDGQLAVPSPDGPVGIVGSSLFDLLEEIPAPLGRDLEEAVREILTGACSYREVKGEWDRAGSREFVTTRIHQVKDHDQARAVLVMVDLTENLRTSERLRRVTEEANLLALVVQQMEHAVLIVDPSGRIEWVNDAYCRITGHEREDLLGKYSRNFSTFLAQEVDMKGFMAALGDGRSVESETQARRKDGSLFWVNLLITPVQQDDTRRHLIHVLRDVTVRRQAEEKVIEAQRQAEALAAELSAEKAVLDEVLASIPHLVYWKDRDLRYAGVNDAFLAVRDAEAHDILRRTESELPITDNVHMVLSEIENEVITTLEPAEDVRVTQESADGGPRQFLFSVLPQLGESGELRGVVGVAADVTQIGELERQLAQATRLESIGQLAAGIAHEINTPIQFVSDNTRFITDCFSEILPVLKKIHASMGEDVGSCSDWKDAVSELDMEFIAEEVPSALTQSLEGLDRVANIVRAMKEFSHPGREQSETDLNRAVESTIQVSRNEWKYVAECITSLDPAVGSVPCFEGEIKQALLNLIVNAAQAIGEDRERTGSMERGQIEVRTTRAGDKVIIEVADNGPGMSEDVQTRIFDPFFTTKDVGKGTGQGLSMVHATVVQKHEGQITVRSQPGEGTTFVIELPAPRPSSEA